jgi:hypothetical protein
MPAPAVSLRLPSVVLIGTFDVRSFTPMALLKSGVLTESEVSAVTAATLFPGQAVSFNTETLTIKANPDRLQVEGLSPPYIRAVDVVSKTIRDNQDFPTRVSAVGINLIAHWIMENFVARDRLGRQLVPLDRWGKWSEQLQEAAKHPPEDPRHAGMTAVIMRLPNPSDRMSGWMDVRVEPSFREKTIAEVIMNANDHYGLPIDEEKAALTDRLALLDVAENRFDASLQRSEEIMTSILEQAK